MAAPLVFEAKAGAELIRGWSYDPALDLIYWGTGNPGPEYDGDIRGDRPDARGYWAGAGETWVSISSIWWWLIFRRRARFARVPSSSITVPKKAASPVVGSAKA